jgi:hypothetical protein
MYGDFTRLTFNPANHYSAVLQQQGRVVVDADHNEMSAIVLHYLRTLAQDLLGPYAGPDTEAAGFVVAPMWDNNKLTDFSISPGRYYVSGILIENEPRPGVDVTYYTQPNAYLEKTRTDDALPEGNALILLRVWERLITAVEDPLIRETALGENGPDTSARLQVVWQAAAIAYEGPLPEGEGPHEAILDWWRSDESTLPYRNRSSLSDRGLLKARGQQPSGTENEVCIQPPTAKYRGAENQLYRVEIHTGGIAGKATFKWSRENGSVIFPIESIAGDRLVLTHLGRDARMGLKVGDTVEVVDDDYTLRRMPERLYEVLEIDTLERSVRLDAAPGGNRGRDLNRRPFLRRWDQTAAGSVKPGPDHTLPVTESDAPVDGFLELEDGVQVQFQPGGKYESGDYWLIPARTVTGDVEWPGEIDDPAALAPYGVPVYFAPLALIIPGGAPDLIDLRLLFKPLTQP